MGEPERFITSAALSRGAQEKIEAMKEQLLIAFVNRLGGSLTLPVDEINGTDAFHFVIGADAAAGIFTFRVVRKEVRQ
ncbi:hypothetical protein ABID82_005239 [Methylobacterium sp. PvP062]|uniref:Uncharacterized protein n=1 Tax=Methylobacterium radiotolerans TaxID=31998 RepID=A0ABV2NQ81_9HYPH|nr:MULTISPECIES: hypothetical protein [unclassified Methylobacterium]MBP2494636.1 hypothetical protein [Methylobacterium sp. PvP105]MBP2505493.1 hypothetical protein [Methylobacterium sp. PvP109]MCX7330109.1 hypothetical protein [Hyphomicrobiales bacterium]